MSHSLNNPAAPESQPVETKDGWQAVALHRVVRPTAILFARRDSIYKSIEGCDVWDIDRDALNFPGGMSVVAHPPCGPWGSLRACFRGSPKQKELGMLAVRLVRENGGVLEHPARSTLWPAAGMPKPGERDKWGGWTMAVPQFWFGHRANKATWLYIVGLEPINAPPVPLKLGEAPCVVTTKHSYTRTRPARPELHTAEREATPRAFAEWLVELARRSRPNESR